MNKLERLWNKIINYLDLDSYDTKLAFRSFIIGKTQYLIFENKEHELFIKNDLIDYIIANRLNFFYFSSLYEFEMVFSFLSFPDNYCFVLIG